MLNKDIFNSERCAKAEASGSLLPEWLDEIYQEKWFKLFVPKALGGLELSLPKALQVQERLARLDGSLGWTVTLCSGAGWFVGFMEDSLPEEVFLNPKVCLAGSGFVGGKADKVGNSFRVNGSWTYASGALHASHLTVNCEILENGIPLLNSQGKPIIKALLLNASEVKILDSWKYMGMMATGSHAFKTEGLQVPLNRCFEISPDKAVLKDPIYQFPFLQFAEATLAVNILGITLHFQRLVNESFEFRKHKNKFGHDQLVYFDHVFSEEEKEIETLKVEFYETIRSSWVKLLTDGDVTDSQLKKVSQSSRKLVQSCRESNAKLYPFAGLEAAKTETELNRVWRDFNTVSQHSLLTFPF